MSTAPRTILHVDLDAFFAAVEQRDNPALRGKPVIVGGGGPDQRGVVSAASYEARKFGVHSAMPLRTACRLCPQGVFLPVDGRTLPAGEPRGDGDPPPLHAGRAADLDRRGVPRRDRVAAAVRRRRDDRAAIKDTIREEVRLTASVGVAATKLVAKIGSDLRKPDGLVVVPPGDEAAFLAPLPISRLWGVGEKTAAVLRDFGVQTIGDLAALPPRGDRAAVREARRVARRRAPTGIDADPVATGEPAKSVGPRAHVRPRHRRTAR